MKSKNPNSISKKKNKPVSKKKIIIGACLIAFAFFGSFLIYFVLQVSLNTQNPMVVVISGSMEPTLNKGDLVFLRGMDPDDIKTGMIEDKSGDIIVYDARGIWEGAPEDPIIHRVVDKINIGGVWYFLTKGDANPYPDRAYIPEDRILGVVSGKIPYIGWIKIFLTDSGLLIPILVILSVLLIISVIWDIIKEEEEDKEEKSTIKTKRAKYLKFKEKYKPVEKFETESDKKDDFDF